MGILLVSGDTSKLTDWDFEEFVPLTQTQSIERLLQYDNDNTIGPCCNGLTYLEIEQLDRRFNN
jgi:hypothetical protein